MYAIMGATGQTGGAALQELRRRGAAVRAITRDRSRARNLFGRGVDIVEADAGDPDSLARAFAGAQGVYVLNVPAHGAADPIAAAARISGSIAAALASARPGRVVALSSEGAHLAAGNGIIRTLHDFETALVGAGAALTRLRASWFMENWAAALAPAQAAGVLPSLLQPLDRPVPMVAVADIGAAVADLLLGDDAPEVVSLAGPRDYAPNAAAAIFAAALGRPVAAVAPPRGSWETELVAAGLGAGYAAELAAMYDAINADALGSARAEQRRGVVTLDAALKAMVANAAAYRDAVPV